MFERQAPEDLKNQVGLWLRRARWGAGLSGLVWTAGAVLFIWNAQPLQQLFTVFTLAGMAAGAVSVLSPDRIAFRLYAWPMIISTAVAMLGYSPVNLAFFVMVGAFLLAITLGANHFHAVLLQSLCLEHEKEEWIVKLQAAKQTAEASNRAKTAFLANVGHELRTPMNGIIGMADLLRAESPRPEQLAWLEPLQTSADQLLGTLNDLIELADLETLQTPLYESPLEIRNWLAHVLSKPAQQAAARGITLRQEIDPHIPDLLLVDVSRLRSLLNHLLKNALKFTEQGEICVAVRLLTLSEQHAEVEWAITDTGIGIAGDQWARLFRPFEQNDDSPTRRHSGLGIGLAIARRLAHLLGGQLSASSQVGKGSCFKFRLPLSCHIEAHMKEPTQGIVEH